MRIEKCAGAGVLFLADPNGMEFRGRAWELSRMPITSKPQSLGPYRVVRPLRAGALSPRWLAQHQRDKTNHVLHEFEGLDERGQRRRFLDAVERLTQTSHPHLLPIDQYSLCVNSGAGYLVTPFTGDQDGLLLLSDLVGEKPDGRLSTAEVGRAISHVCLAMDHAHGEGLLHGEISEPGVLVDRRGSLMIELYGLGTLLSGGGRPDADDIADEVRSMVQMAMRLLTGVDAADVRPSRIVKKLDKAWDRWFERGLDAAGGFESAAEALALLPVNGGGRELRKPMTAPTVVIPSRRSVFTSAGS